MFRFGNKHSVLFVSPDYHCSFFYREELRKFGWECDIYLPNGYPESLLFSKKGLTAAFKVKNSSKISRIFNHLSLMVYYLFVFWRYKYHIYYCSLDYFGFQEKNLGLSLLFGRSFQFSLFLAKYFGCKIIYVPSGVPDEEMPHIVFKLGNEEVGLPTRDPEQMRIWFERINRYCDRIIGFGKLDSTQYKASHIKYKSMDLNLWKKDLIIPEKHRLPATKKLRILHSFKFKNRRADIKGSQYVQKAVDRLISEGYSVEFLFLENIESKDMRYYQAQADIVVEQLIRGWWGSTGIECMALGKPVVCYLRNEWKDFFFSTFPEYKELPIIEANKDSIYDVLKTLVKNEDFRENAGLKSRLFAESHFDIERNADSMTHFLKSI